jgi:hypothetical protein
MATKQRRRIIRKFNSEKLLGFTKEFSSIIQSARLEQAALLKKEFHIICGNPPTLNFVEG